MIRYGEYINDYLMVKPGITGMWQVSGRSDTDYKQRVQLDSWYVRKLERMARYNAVMEDR